MNRIVVVGGGISGLAAAHRVHELNPSIEVTLLEASEQAWRNDSNRASRRFSARTRAGFFHL